MLGKTDAIATVAVKDLGRARTFYEGPLGLERNGTDEPGVVSYRTGGTSLLVYESRYAGTNQATAATWEVDDVDGLVRELKGKGVTFERYDLPETKHEGDVHVAGSTRVAWFKDPDGNILALVGGSSGSR